ncbi:MAG: hypothetical protein GY724_00480 [Actinomycetia bacterium]|nr:hypothetical protein [Actinomycetes bacterium]
MDSVTLYPRWWFLAASVGAAIGAFFSLRTRPELKRGRKEAVYVHLPTFEVNPQAGQLVRLFSGANSTTDGTDL